ncbi:DUF4179 domain-containing protein [Alkalicoccobacillus porphyridii]|uniref:DUF4179 domain-containing protein n=1 Tax=Alkalicoccobacillus porphyridii TaxID=2597270 RepID=A0A554A290_9BACI|nr:DUF4179 domain-containing protein [Alkalicoccobacillus porphyridii]TSB47795.1 DUF4179 domain-containing protein [Alkalicoccobacillus porphyridii]
MKKPLEEFPEDQVVAAIRTGIDRAKNQPKHSHSNKTKGRRKIIYALSSVAAIFGILVGSSYYSPALASSLSQIPIIGSVFGDSDLMTLQQAQKNGLTSEVGETQTVNGISVTLDELLFDQNNITLGLFIESEKELTDFYFGAGMDFTINGKNPPFASGTYDESVISPTTRTAIQEINVTENTPEQFEMGLILYGESGEEWYFSVPVEKISDIQTIPVHHTQTVENLTINVPEISISQTGLSLSYTGTEMETDFELARGQNVEFTITDQNGNKIEGTSGGVIGELVSDRIEFKSNKPFDPIDSSVTELTITPHVVIPESGGGVEIDKDGNEKEIPVKEMSLEPIEFESFKVKIPQ